MEALLKALGQLDPRTLAVLAAVSGAIGAIVAAIITAVIGKIIVTPFLSARDRQDKEAEWRKHAVELTKLDLERKFKTRIDGDKRPIRPSILDFLANYRDLQELGSKTPKDLYNEILAKRISSTGEASHAETQSKSLLATDAKPSTWSTDKTIPAPTTD